MENWTWQCTGQYFDNWRTCYKSETDGRNCAKNIFCKHTDAGNNTATFAEYDFWSGTLVVWTGLDCQSNINSNVFDIPTALQSTVFRLNGTTYLENSLLGMYLQLVGSRTYRWTVKGMFNIPRVVSTKPLTVEISWTLWSERQRDKWKYMSETCYFNQPRDDFEKRSRQFNKPTKLNNPTGE